MHNHPNGKRRHGQHPKSTDNLFYASAAMVGKAEAASIRMCVYMYAYMFVHMHIFVVGAHNSSALEFVVPGQFRGQLLQRKDCTRVVAACHTAQTCKQASMHIPCSMHTTSVSESQMF